VAGATCGITLAAVFLISQILIIVTTAGIYSWLLTTSGIPQSIVSAMKVNLIGSFLERPAAHHDPHAAAARGRGGGGRSHPLRRVPGRRCPQLPGLGRAISEGLLRVVGRCRGDIFSFTSLPGSIGGN
jgi:hypothetical protein